MKTTLIFAGAITLVLISMESPAFGSPAPPNQAIASLMSDTLIDNEGLVRQKRGTTPYGRPCRYQSDCRSDLVCCVYAAHSYTESSREVRICLSYQVCSQLNQ